MRGDAPDAAAQALAKYARAKAGDSSHLSPFAYGAQQLGYRYFGGKVSAQRAQPGLACLI